MSAPKRLRYVGVCGRCGVELSIAFALTKESEPQKAPGSVRVPCMLCEALPGVISSITLERFVGKRGSRP